MRNYFPSLFYLARFSLISVLPSSHEPVHSLVTSDRVYRMEMGLHGVWVTYRS